MKSRSLVAVLLLSLVASSVSAAPIKSRHHNVTTSSVVGYLLHLMGLKDVVVPPPPPKPPRILADGGACVDPNGGTMPCVPPKP
jgi:hypothetical protein